MVLLGTRKGEVLALSETDGATLWEATVSSEVLAAPRVESSVVVIRTIDGKLFGLAGDTGRRLWSYDRQVPVLTLRGTSAPVTTRDLVIAGFDNGGLAALELRTGKVAWEAPIAQPAGRTDLERMVDVDADPLVLDGTLYVASYQGRVAAVFPDSGQILWEEKLSSHAGIGVDEKYLYVSDDAGRISALDRYSGRSAWRRKTLRGREPTAPAASGEYVVVGDIEGYLHWLRRDTGDLAVRVRVDDSRILVPPLVVDEVVIGYSSEGTLTAYRAAEH
jgi:outer membrane protein assembly factor BamB